jgi:hypothetical protein
MANNSIKLFIILLLICYIILIVYIYFYKKYKIKEDFIGILEVLKEYNDNLNIPNKNNVSTNYNTTEVNKTEVNKTEVNNTEVNNTEVNNTEVNKKQVNKKQVNKTEVNTKQETRIIYIEQTHNPSKYRFYDKNFNNYTNLYIDDKNIKLYDINNNIIGKLISEIYNKFTLSYDFYDKNNIHIDFYNNFKELKLYIEDDDKYFYIKNIDNIYRIFLFNKNIGKIDYDNFTYKIIVYEEYKNYLNLFAVGLILLLRN